MKKASLITGVSLLFVGVVSLLGALEVIPFGMAYIWPLFLLVPGLYFQIIFFVRKDTYQEEILIPSTILIIYALLFIIAGAKGFDFLGRMWPFFPLGVSLGFLQAYLLGSRKMAYYFIGQILLVFSVMAIIFNSLGLANDTIVFPLVLMTLGLVAIGQTIWKQMTKMDAKPPLENEEEEEK